MAELLIGTCGYDYTDWKGGFYPEKLARKNFLEFYATKFNSLELNGTYYNMPSNTQMQNMITRTSGKVKFAVKAFQDMTHGGGVVSDTSRNLVFEFRKAMDPLMYHNLLTCVLLQFPQKFHREKNERFYLDWILKELGDIPVVVEMRNVQWQNDVVYNALRQRKVGWCITDNPDLKDLPKLDYICTSDIAYMRFHGRNAAMWYKGDNVTRYDYLYSDSELEGFVRDIKMILSGASHPGSITPPRIVQLFFNNHAKSQAVINAKKLEMMLK
jgi:uncharacterized protein YecE (DUF72 family)